MNATRDLPGVISQWLATRGAPIRTVARLGGMSSARVYRVATTDETFILKHTTRTTEVAFYRQTAQILAQRAHCVPALYAVLEDHGEQWLILEEIPHPLPRDRWLADPAALAILRHVHTSDSLLVRGSPDQYHPSWTMDMNERALSFLAHSDAESLAPRIEALRQTHQYLFAAEVPLSGDPNPSNWGIREDGSLVLYDWERFCLGTPTLDLAVTIPGLGDRAAFLQTGARYLELAPVGVPGTPMSLAHDIGVSKLWSVIEFLSQIRLGDARVTGTMCRLRQEVPGWMRAMFAL